MKALALLFLALAATGCVSTSKVLQAMGKDPATVAVSVQGWGTSIYVHRANPVTGMSSQISPDGTLIVSTVSTNR